MGAKTSKKNTTTNQAIKNEVVPRADPLEASKSIVSTEIPRKLIKLVEFVQDIASIRRAARNKCITSGREWFLDSIKHDWLMTVKHWSSSKMEFIESNDLHGIKIEHIQDSREKLRENFANAEISLERMEGLEFPVMEVFPYNGMIGEDSFHEFHLNIVLGTDRHYKKVRHIPCLTLLFVASEQKGDNCRLVYGVAYLNLKTFRASLGLPPYFIKSANTLEITE